MPLELVIVTPEGEAYHGPVERVVLPGAEGEFGVLSGHERFLAPIRIGPLAIGGRDGFERAAISDGFAEITGERVTVMVETCERADQIDVERARQALGRAERRLAELRQRGEASEHRVRLVRADLERATTRLAIARRP